ncbi:MAG TPA: prepilin peptidase [Terriglobales bacterium]|nr:prepilin peptidase [Terriglobales bacterium]
MDIFFAIGSFVFGLLFGSFLNVCIHRIPRKQSVVFPSSACPVCHEEIKPYDNIPVLSWLFLGGRCRNCRTPITPRYAMVELLTAFFFLASYWNFGLTFSTLKYCVFSFLIIGLIFIDAEWKLLPDKLTLPGLAIGLGFSWFVPVDQLLADILPAFFSPPTMRGWSWRLLSFTDSLFGAAVGAAFIFGVGFVYLHARGVEGMGFGDVKLMAMVGAFLGVKLTVFTIFAASLLGTIFGMAMILHIWSQRTRRRMLRHRETPELARQRAWRSAKLVYRYYQMPFGVFLGGMALFALFFGNQLLHWYWRLYL